MDGKLEVQLGDELLLPLLSSFSITTSICSAILIAIYFYYRNAYNYWHKRGVKTPPPLPVAGNFAHMLFKDRIKLDLDWAQKYGKIYGLYQGTKPILVVADADVLRQICIKDFDKLPNHDKIEFPNKFQSKFVIALRDEHWKRVRAMMTPTFTSGKIKRMIKLLEACCDDLIMSYSEQVAAKSSGTNSAAILNIKELFGLFTLDAITSCCYGLKLERAGAGSIKTAAKRNEFVQIGFKILRANIPRTIFNMITPKPLLRAINFETQSSNTIKPLADRVEQVIKKRRASGRRFDDYLQILLDAKFDDKMELNEMDAKENHHAGITASNSLIDDHKKMVADVEMTKQQSNGAASAVGTKIELTEMEILANAIFLLMVGLETTTTILTHCTYILGFHLDVQERLYQELKLIAKETSKNRYEFDYDELTSCQYLDAVISETLRILSPVFFLDRYPLNDYYIEKYNINVEKGTRIELNYYAIMNDPDYWPNPRKFNPERFMPANKDKIYPGSYCPFGIGPRHCLGMRFSLTEAKLGMANMIMNYKFEQAPGTIFPPKGSFSLLFLSSITNPLSTVIKRQSN